MKKMKYISIAVFLITAIFLTVGLAKLTTSGKINQSGGVLGQASTNMEELSKDGTEYPIYIETNDGGSITIDCEMAKEGQTVTISVTENPGYELKEIYLDEEKLQDKSFVMPGHAVVLSSSFARNTEKYDISVKNSRYGRVLVEEETTARAGDKITVDYYALNGYVLDYITLNDQKTKLDSQNAFTMPGEDVVVSAVFKKAIDETDITIKTENWASDADSYWYFEYAPSGFRVTAKVIDATVIGTGEAKYQDYVECMFNIYEDGATKWQPGKTVVYTVTAGGKAYVQTAYSTMGLMKPTEVNEGFTYSVTEKQIMYKDGYSGYEIQMEIPYELLGTTYEQACGNILVCPASRNSESLVTRKWKNECSWFDISTHYRVSEDGSIAE